VEVLGFYSDKLQKQLAKSNCLAPRKREERLIRSKAEIRVLDVKTLDLNIV